MRMKCFENIDADDSLIVTICGIVAIVLIVAIVCFSAVAISANLRPAHPEVSTTVVPDR